MAFSNVYDELPSLRGYERALEHHNSIAPIRGKSPEIRPIVNTRLGRRRHHMRIELTQSPTPRSTAPVPGVACVLYRTQVVTFFEDGTVRLLSDGYHSISTAKFMEQFIPGRVRTTPGVQSLRWTTGQHGDIKIENELWLDHDGEHSGLYPVDPKPFVVHTIDRMCMKGVKAPYKAFVDYATALGRLTNWACPDNPPAASTGLTHLRMTSENIDEHAAAFAYAVGNAGTFDYHYQNGVYGRRWRCTEAMFKRWFSKFILQEYATSVLTRVELPIGTYKADPHRSLLRRQR